MAIFRKVLTNPDVERRLSIPDTCSLEALPPLEGGNAVKLQVKDDESGQVWTFQFSIRDKPVIIAGWLQFVRTKDLKIGDIIKFYKDVDQATGAQYKIEVKRVNRVTKCKPRNHTESESE